MPYLDLLAKYGMDSAHPGGFELTRELLKRESITSSTSILDAGCGTGLTSAYIAKNYGSSVTAVDVNPAMLLKASQRFIMENVNVKLHNANVTQLPFPSGSFDIVLAESVTIFTAIWKSVMEYFRVLKRGGTLIDIELTAELPLTIKETKEVGEVYGVEWVPTQDEWCRLLWNSGFTCIQAVMINPIQHYGFLSFEFVQDFLPHFLLMNKYMKKLGYRVYRCKVA